jgi:hypothetical protein
VVIGAGTILLGAITLSEGGGQFEFKTINTETGADLGAYSTAVEMDETLAALLGSPLPSAAPMSEPTTPPPAPVASAPAPAVSDTPDTPDAVLAPVPVKDFSVGRRIASVGMNPLFGLGSYTMGDWRGGVILSVGYAVAAGLILWDLDIIPVNGWFGLESTAPLFPETGAFIDKFGIPGTVGLGIAAATTVFGILRPIFYHRPASSGHKSASKVAQALRGAGIAVIPAGSPHESGIKAVRLSYSFTF